jgi:branched-chain amino acid transport system substrate-binding protein
VRAAQAKYGNKPLTGEQVRWGLEHLNIDATRIRSLGMDGMLQPLQTSCQDHEGAHRYRLHAWDGARWNYSSDWYESNAQLLRPMMDAAAQKYADDKHIPLRDCGAQG